MTAARDLYWDRSALRAPRSFKGGGERLRRPSGRQTGLSKMYGGRVTDAFAPDQAPPSAARQRLLDNAYELFSRRGIRAVGVEEVISRAAVAKATLYRHFPSKDDLVLAFLEERERRWTRQFVEAGARERGASAEERLLAIFDVFDDWFQQENYEGCSFINVLLETGDREHPVGHASAQYLANIRTIVRTLAEEAGLRDPEAFALSWHLLMKGAIVQAAEGDRQAAQRAKAIARLLLDQHR
jgi:AcrR family transcriptional regulator